MCPSARVISSTAFSRYYDCDRQDEFRLFPWFLYLKTARPIVCCLYCLRERECVLAAPYESFRSQCQSPIGHKGESLPHVASRRSAVCAEGAAFGNL